MNSKQRLRSLISRSVAGAHGPGRFPDRRAAGRTLAAGLGHHAGDPRLVVLGLPRGGVPVAYEVAASLGARFDVFLVRKLGVPGQEELAMGAIASGGTRVLNPMVIERLGISEGAVESAVRTQQAVLAEQEAAYRQGRPPVAVDGATVILVDDGLATGASMRAAIAALRRRDPASLCVAVPIAAAETCESLRAEADEVICTLTPEPFYAVGVWYDDFSQVTDQEVTDLLEAATRFSAPT